MFEYYGWAAVIDSPGESEPQSLRRIVDELRSRIDTLRLNGGVRDLRAVNGLYQVVVAGFANHRGLIADELIGFLEYLGRVAPGSYGLLYLRDDEEPGGKDNQFRVWVLARGRLEEREDPFLSPCIPVIEDP